MNSILARSPPRSIPIQPKSGALSAATAASTGFDCAFLEDATSNARCDIADERDCTVDDLCLTVGHELPDADFTQAARYTVLRHYAPKIPDSLPLPPELRALKELTGRRHVQ
jgi:hypothetical protein